MRFDILTLFPEMVKSVLDTSILKRAKDSELISTFTHDIRDSATDNHKTVDDTPYGGGARMLLKVDIMDSALANINNIPEIQQIDPEKRRIILMTPQGRRFNQEVAKELATYQQITLICGHYEGFDERIRDLVDEEISIGDFVLTGGELPALCVLDATARMIPGVLNQDTPEEESWSMLDEQGNPLIEYPHYTRPFEYKGQQVPEVLTSGNHAAIKAWRLEQAKERTKKLRESI